MMRTVMARQAIDGGGIMDTSAKRYAAAVGLRKTLGILVAAALVAAAATGWSAKAGAPAQAAATTSSGHYKLQPLW
jgi:hypothetical protein